MATIPDNGEAGWGNELRTYLLEDHGADGFHPNHMTSAEVIQQIQDDTDEVGDGDLIGFEDVGGVQTPYPKPGNVYVAHNYNGTNVGSTTTEGDLHTAPWTIPANEIVVGTTVYQIDLIGNYVNNSGSNRDVTFRIRFAGSALLTFTFSAIPTNANNRYWRATGFIKVIDFFGTPIWTGGATWVLGAPLSGAVFQTQHAGIDGANAVNVTIANDIDITMQHSSATTSGAMPVGIAKRIA